MDRDRERRGEEGGEKSTTYYCSAAGRSTLSVLLGPSSLPLVLAAWRHGDKGTSGRGPYSAGWVELRVWAAGLLCCLH